MNKETKILNGILIDPFLKKVTNVKVDKDKTLTDMYKHIGCSMVEVVSFSDRHDLWVDEEGLLERDQRFFKVHNLPFGHPGIIAGRALILGVGDEGETKSANLFIADILPRISWDFTHDGMVYNSETGLFTRVEVVRNGYKVESDIVDSIKSIHVIE